MFWHFSPNRKAGMSLVELMLTAFGMAIVVALVGTQFHRSMQTESKALSVQSFASVLGLALSGVQNTDTCQGALVDGSGNKILITATSIAEIRAYGSAGAALLSMSRPTISPTTQLKAMILENTTLDAPVTLATGVVLTRYYADLKVQAQEVEEGKITSLQKLLPLSLLVDSTGVVQTCGTPQGFTPGSSGVTVSSEITVEFNKTGPYSNVNPFVFDANLTNWTLPHSDHIIADASYKTCFLTQVLNDSDTTSEKPNDAIIYHIDHKPDGNHLIYRGHYIGSQSNALDSVKFSFRCVQ